jgi:hypothetical protein
VPSGGPVQIQDEPHGGGLADAVAHPMPPDQGKPAIVHPVMVEPEVGTGSKK